MALSRLVIKELQSELETLRQRRVALDARIQGIELVLEQVHDEQTADASERRPRPVLHRQRQKRGSLRRRLIAMLSEAESLKGRELYERLDSERFQVGGKASLRERVSHELSRLQRLGVVRRNGTGTYQLSAASKDPALIGEASRGEHAFA